VRNQTTKILTWIGGVALAFVLATSIVSPPPLESWSDWIRFVVIYLGGGTAVIGWLLILLIYAVVSLANVLRK